MTQTDRASIFIVTLFYGLTLLCGYFLHTHHLEQGEILRDRLILNVRSDQIQKNNTVVLEERGGENPTKKIHEVSSLLDIYAIYEREGYKLEHISEWQKQVLDQEVLVTRIWFSKRK